MSSFSKQFASEFGASVHAFDSSFDSAFTPAAVNSFSCEFDDDFASGCDSPVTLAYIPLDLAERPRHPPYSPLWRRFQYPCTPAAILLWETGEVIVADSYDERSLTADDVIHGGRPWFAPGDSWQATVLEAAGFTLTDYEGSIA